jgi:glycosyltransferase involved in cell wall biosynthesis
MNGRIIALVPAFNEAANVGDVVARTRPHVSAVIVIDDGSRDQTGAVAEAAGATVIRHQHNYGKGAAIMTALEHFRDSDAAYAVFLDADGQHDPAEIPKFVAAAQPPHVAMVIGTRMQHTETMPLQRRLANRLTSWLTSRLARQAIPDSQCGYRLLTRAAVADLKLATAHFETETEMLIQVGRAGHTIASVPIRTIYTASHASHIRPVRDTVRFFRLVKKYLF